MPVPASIITVRPDERVTSTHVVLPPYTTVFGPGEAMEPLVPQNVILIVFTCSELKILLDCPEHNRLGLSGHEKKSAGWLWLP